MNCARPALTFRIGGTEVEEPTMLNPILWVLNTLDRPRKTSHVSFGGGQLSCSNQAKPCLDGRHGASEAVIKEEHSRNLLVL